MANPFRGRGFKAYREEADRREQIREQKRGKLWRLFLKDGEEDVVIRFLTDEPILFYEHSFQDGGKWINATCTGEDCPFCADGKRPQYKGAFLVIDTREFETDERDAKGEKTGKKITVKDRVKLFVRGQKDLAKLDRLCEKRGLLKRPYALTKIGSGNQSTYEYDYMDEDPISQKQLQKYLSQLPEKYRGMDVYDIIEANLFDDGEEDNKSDTSSKSNKSSLKRKDIEDEIEDEVVNVEHKTESRLKRQSPKDKTKKTGIKIRRK